MIDCTLAYPIFRLPQNTYQSSLSALPRCGIEELSFASGHLTVGVPIAEGWNSRLEYLQFLILIFFQQETPPVTADQDATL